MPDLAGLRTLVRDAAGLDPADPLHADAHLTSHLNAALRRIDALPGDPYWLVSETSTALVADQASYALAANVTRVRYVEVDKDDCTARLLAYRQSDVAVLKHNLAGVPHAYSADSTNVVLTPAPAASYLPATLRVGLVTSEAGLVADADLPLLPERYHDALVTYAAMRASIRANNPEVAAMLRGEADGWLLTIQRDMRRSLAGPRVQVVREWGGRGYRRYIP